jgi:hypothetical protein
MMHMAEGAIESIWGHILGKIAAFHGVVAAGSQNFPFI